MAKPKKPGDKDKKKAGPRLSDIDDIDKALMQIEKDLGGTVTLTRMDVVRTPYHIRRPCGIMSLDAATDGGAPGGSIVQLHGRWGAGKTALAGMYIAENQRIYGAESAVFWVTFGYKPDLSLFRLCGAQIAFTDQELEEAGIDPETATPEERGNTIGRFIHLDLSETDDASLAPAEMLLSAAARLVSTGKFQIGVVDELGSGETADSIKKDFDENEKMAAWAALIARFCKRVYTVLRPPLKNGEPNATTLFVINPARANIEGAAKAMGKYTVPDNQTSGFALGHAKALDILLRSSSAVKDKGNVIGKEIVWRLIKGKHGIAEGAEGKFVWLHSIGVDLHDDMSRVAKAYDVIQSKGKYAVVEGWEGKFEGGIAAVVAALREDSDLYEHMRALTMQRIQESATGLEEADEE